MKLNIATCIIRNPIVIYTRGTQYIGYYIVSYKLNDEANGQFNDLHSRMQILLTIDMTSIH